VSTPDPTSMPAAARATPVDQTAALEIFTGAAYQRRSPRTPSLEGQTRLPQETGSSHPHPGDWSHHLKPPSNPGRFTPTAPTKLVHASQTQSKIGE
jgi:hypothetical protein